MCHHFVVGLGFLLGPVILAPFLPGGEGEGDRQREEACQQQKQEQEPSSKNSTTAEHHHPATIEGMAWPFSLVFAGHVACGLAYLILVRVPWKMPGGEI